MSERQTTGEFTNYIIGKRSGKTYNQIQEMAKEIVRLEKENKELKEKYENINWYFENQKDNFVHKNKIKNKIKELEEDKEENLQGILELKILLEEN